MLKKRQIRHRGVRCVVLGLAGVCSAVLLAQDRDSPLEPGPTTVGQLGTSQPTFRSGVTLVSTDVVVRDDDGAFVPDLGREDFRVFEDVIEQEIASLVLVVLL